MKRDAECMVTDETIHVWSSMWIVGLGNSHKSYIGGASLRTAITELPHLLKAAFGEAGTRVTTEELCAAPDRYGNAFAVPFGGKTKVATDAKIRSGSVSVVLDEERGTYFIQAWVRRRRGGDCLESADAELSANSPDEELAKTVVQSLLASREATLKANAK
jgi:hypothetical protein